MPGSADAFMAEAKQNLVGLLQKTGAVRVSDRKEFRLASGEMSDHYFDLRLLCGDPDGIACVARAFYGQIRRLGAAAPIKSVGGLESGSISIATAVSLLSGQEHPRGALSSFFVRKNRKEHGTKKMIEGAIRPPVVVVDDVITSGGSAMAAVGALRDAGYDCGHIIAVIFRGTAEQEREIGKHAQLHYMFRAPEILGLLKG